MLLLSYVTDNLTLQSGKNIFKLVSGAGQFSVDDLKVLKSYIENPGLNIS